jgi:hypothetical protein
MAKPAQDGGSYFGDFAGGLKEWGIFLQGSSMRDSWREGSFTGDPKGYVK